MCLAIPGKLIEIFEQNGLRMGKIDYAGTVNTACIAYTPEATIGQYVIVHAGFAISVIDEAEAQETLALWRELIEDEQKGDKSGTPD
jgi:hydrogenase expression/formation protein HypC